MQPSGCMSFTPRKNTRSEVSCNEEHKKIRYSGKFGRRSYEDIRKSGKFLSNSDAGGRKGKHPICRFHHRALLAGLARLARASSFYEIQHTCVLPNSNTVIYSGIDRPPTLITGFCNCTAVVKLAYAPTTPAPNVVWCSARI
jgi:hypothetical protein